MDRRSLRSWGLPPLVPLGRSVQQSMVAIEWCGDLGRLQGVLPERLRGGLKPMVVESRPAPSWAQGVNSWPRVTA